MSTCSLEDRKQAKDMITNFTVPVYFQDDLLQIMGETKRPPFRWFLIGPKRSGSTVHIDPLGTSAWNTSFQGHKRWILFPNEYPKEIVKGKKYLQKGEEYEAIAYFAKLLPRIKKNEGENLKYIEFIQNPGETVFVPGGWWHAVVNVDNTMAITQNVMTKNNFDHVWRYIRKERKKMAVKYLEKLKTEHPKLYQRALELNEQDKFMMFDEKQKLLGKRKANVQAMNGNGTTHEYENLGKKMKTALSATSSSSSSSDSDSSDSSSSDSDSPAKKSK
jgi:histone arginine demethylase JMJD6